MKILKAILFCTAIILFFTCSPNNDDEMWYIATLGDTCECKMYDLSCAFNLHVSVKEYTRIKKLREESSDPCLYVFAKSIYTGDIFEGYLLGLFITENLK